jgi:DNA repair exonuclease SbcCD nuclease subunit
VTSEHAGSELLETVADLPEVAVAHVSDTHLGYEAYAARSVSGNNQRGEDVVRAFHRAVDDICAWDPPLVIHSGDVAERPQVPIRYMLAIRSELARLAGVRPDGTRRQLVVIAGNHDASRHLKEGCFLELYRGLPGVHIVTTASRDIVFDPAADGCDPVLASVTVTAVPHDSLRLPEVLADARPHHGRVNILTTHGVAEGSDLFVRAVGREYPIPADLLLRGWDYVALGHWHVQGPVPVSGASGASRAYYAGSTEHIDFSDVKGASGTERAWLAVTVRPGQTPVAERRAIPVRPMVNLPVLDAGDASPDDIVAALIDHLTAAEIDGAVVRQKVRGVSRDIWALVDTSTVRAAAGAALHYRIDTSFAVADTGAGDDGGDPRNGLGDIGRLLVERAGEMVPEADRDATLELARTLLGSVLDTDAGIDPDADSGESPATESPATESPATESPATEPGPSPTEHADPADGGDDTDTGTDTDGETPAPPARTIPPPLADPAAAFASINAELGISALDGDAKPTAGVAK